MRLEEIVNIQFGLTSRPKEGGNTKLLHAKHFNQYGFPTNFSDSYIKQDPSFEKFLLNKGDVLLTGKGNRIFAWAYEESFGAAIPSALFYILRPKSNNVYSNYLSMFLNTERVKYQLEMMGAGATMLSIPKNELRNLKIILPSLEQQEELIRLEKLLNLDVSLTEELLIEKKQLRQALISDIINQKT